MEPFFDTLQLNDIETVKPMEESKPSIGFTMVMK